MTRDERPGRGLDARGPRAGAARARPGLAQPGGRLRHRRRRNASSAAGAPPTAAGRTPRRVALAQAGARARGATVYVTLEPCAHTGRTPPCTEALIAAGVARVVVADRGPRPAGQRRRRSRRCGRRASRSRSGCLAAEAVALNRGFLIRLTTGRPMLTLKLAASLDGRIATGTGESRWITGPRARAEVHLMRAQSDAVLVGAGTVRSDDPKLNVRGLGIDGRASGARGGERGAVAAARRPSGADRARGAALALPRRRGRGRAGARPGPSSAPS